MTLFKQQAKAEWVTLLVWGVIIGAITFFGTALYESMYRAGALAKFQEMFQTMPESTRAMFGAAKGGFPTLAGWLTIFTLGQWMLIGLVIYTALFVAGIVTREMDRRTMEFLLGLPVSRTQVLLSRWAGMVAALVGLVAAHLAGLIAGVATATEPLPAGRLVLADLNLWLLLVAMGTILLFISIFVDDYGRGVGAVLGVGVGFVFANSALESATGALKTLREVLPLGFYDPGSILTGTMHWSHLGVLAAITAVALGLSLYCFQRKQIAV